MTHPVCLRCIVSGRVQGVWYRAGTRQRAIGLGVSGHARNLSNGDVEVLACGEPEAVRTLCDWLWEGTPAAEVTDVACETVPAPARLEGFTTG